jgi:hypothetical protein
MSAFRLGYTRLAVGVVVGNTMATVTRDFYSLVLSQHATARSRAAS